MAEGRIRGRARRGLSEGKREKGKRQNAEINLLKLIFAIVVFFYHFTLNYNFGLTYAGYIAVDYFLILSGIFLHRKLGKSGWKIHPVRYLGRRYLQFLPFILYTFAIEVILRAVREGGVSFTLLLQWIYEAKWELLCLSCFGLKAEWIFYPPLWFISSLLFGSFVLLAGYWFLGKRFDRAALLIAAGIYIYLFLTLGHLRAEGEYLFVFTKGTYRAIADLCLGLSAERLIGPLKRKMTECDRREVCNQVVRIGAWCLAAYALYAHRLHPTTRLDFWFIVVMTAVFVMILSLDEPEKMETGRLSAAAGKLSMAVYFNHNYLMELPVWNAIVNPLVRAAALSVGVAAASALALAVIRGCKKLWKYLMRTLHLPHTTHTMHTGNPGGTD